MFVAFHQAAQIRPPPSFAGSQQSWKGTSGVPALSVDQHISWWHGDCRAHNSTAWQLDMTEVFSNFAKFRLSKVMVDTAKVSQCKFPLVCNVRIQKLQERIQFLYLTSIGKSPTWSEPQNTPKRCRNTTPLTQMKGKNNGKRMKTLLFSKNCSASFHCAVEDWCPRNQDDAFSWWRNLDESLRPGHTWRLRRSFYRLLFRSHWF